MDYHKDDFKKLLIPSYSLQKADEVGEKCVLLKKYDIFFFPLLELDRAEIIKFISFCYDEHSPFVRDYEDPRRRKVEAANFIGFDKDEHGAFEIKYSGVFLGINENVNKMIIQYCRLQRNTEFSKLVIFEEAYYQELLLLKDSSKDNKTKDVRTNINNFAQDIKNAKQALLMGDENQRLMVELLREVEFEQIELSPEEIAGKIENNEEVVNFYPYGKAYVVDKLKLDADFAKDNIEL